MATLIGIEVGTRIVRAALVRTTLRATTVVRYIEVSLDDMRALADAPPVVLEAYTPIAGLPEAGHSDVPVTMPMAPVSTEPDLDAPLRMAIAEVMRRAGVASATRIADMPGQDVSLRRIELPPAAIRKMDELLPFEMEALIPFDAAESLLDYQLAEPPEPTKIRVVVVAVPRVKVRERLDQLGRAGLDPEELIPGPAALGGLVPFVPALASEGAQMLVHLGRAQTDVAVLRKGKLELARTISAGADDLREAGFGEAPFGSGAERLFRELRQTVATHRMQGGADPEAVRVSGELDGGEALMHWLGRALDTVATSPTGEQITRGVIPLELPAAPELDPTMPADSMRRPAFALALGLAGHALLKGKRLDLRRGDLAKKRSMGALRELTPLLGVCAAFVVVAYFYSVYAHWSVLTARREVLESELAAVTEARLGESTRDATHARGLLETGRQSPDPLPAYDAFDALLSLSAAIPDGIDHDVQRLQIDLGDERSGGHLELQAIVTSIEERDRIAQALGEVTCFRNLEIGPMTAAGEGRRQYRMELDVQCPGTPGADDTHGRGRRRGHASGSASGSGGTTGGTH